MSTEPIGKSKEIQNLGPSEQERIAVILEGNYISIPSAATILLKIEDLFELPKRHRMPGLLVLGEPSSGKSTIARKFAKNHPPMDDPAADAIEVPVLLIELGGVNESAFYEEILDKLGQTTLQESVLARKKRALNLMRKLKVRMLLVDEFNNAVSGTPREQRKFLTAIRTFMNVLQIPIVGFGTEKAELILAHDDALKRRFYTTVAIGRWAYDDQFRGLLAALEDHFQLKHVSTLYDSPLDKEIFQLTEGITGEIFELLQQAAKAAIRTGKERITSTLLKSLQWSKPSERGQRSGRIIASNTLAGDRTSEPPNPVES